ncbi:MAG: hypothetical protein RQ990_05060 [Candidatus Hydrothermia bacterium]|nr:hypothetical protein [Candidatus Hydrothermia bacterium]
MIRLMSIFFIILTGPTFLFSQTTKNKNNPIQQEKSDSSKDTASETPKSNSESESPNYFIVLLIGLVGGLLGGFAGGLVAPYLGRVIGLLNYVDRKELEDYVKNYVKQEEFNKLKEDLQKIKEDLQKGSNKPIGENSLKEKIKEEVIKEIENKQASQNKIGEIDESKIDKLIEQKLNNKLNDLKRQLKVEEIEQRLNEKFVSKDAFNQELNKKADREEIESLVDGIIKQNLDSKLNDLKNSLKSEFNQELNKKVDKSEINSLQQELSKKADKSEIEKIEQELNKKADVKEINSLREELGKKADKNSVVSKDEFNQELNKKADKSEIKPLEERLSKFENKFKEEEIKKEVSKIKNIIDNSEYKNMIYNRDFDKLYRLPSAEYRDIDLKPVSSYVLGFYIMINLKSLFPKEDINPNLFILIPVKEIEKNDVDKVRKFYNLALDVSTSLKHYTFSDLAILENIGSKYEVFMKGTIIAK